MGNPVSYDKLTYKDGILLSLILIIYCLFAFRDLGSMSAPQTLHPLTNEEYVMLDFGEHLPTHLFLYIGAAAKQDFYLYSWDYDKGEWISLNQFQVPYCFTWTDVEFSPTSSQILLQTSSENAPLLELSFYDASGIRLLPNNTNEYQNLFDEQSTFKGYKDHRNSMYFDEIYHARTAYEYIHGLKAYENTHPPLGKILLSLGIRLFGMTPFGWRIMGTLFGVFMLPVLYLFLRKMLKDSGLSFLGTFIFAFDFMHFTQTRIATIDVYVTFFILCMYFFMYLYVNKDLCSESSSFIPLALCGLSMGLGIACKWTGVYAGMGLTVIFFAKWISTYKTVRNKTTADKTLLSHKMKSTFLLCLVFFVALPFVIYLLSYLPMKDGSNRNLFSRMLANQSYMLSYHKDLSATHPYGSPFYQWPVMIRPVWYYSRVVNDTLREGISTFGNPLVWWVGIIAAVFLLIHTIRKKDRIAAFLLVGYFAQYLPWFFVSRVTFIYHYFPSVVFVVMMITYCFDLLKKKLPRKMYHALFFSYILGVFCLFLLFYPVLSGQSVEVDYVTKYLKWLENWVLVSSS